MPESSEHAPGPWIELWEGPDQTCGSAGMPSPVFHIHGRAGSDAPLHSLSWSLNGRGRIPVAVGPSAFRVSKAGDFTIFLERAWLRAGRNELLILANDEKGRESTSRVSIDLHTSSRASLPMRAEWAGARRAGQRAEIIDGRWRIEDDSVRTAEPGYDRALALGDLGWTDFDIRVPITIHGLDTHPAHMQWPSMGCAVGVVLRWRRHADWGDILPARGWFPLGAMVRFEHQPGDPADTARLRIRAGGFVPALAETPTIELPPGTRLMLRARVRSQTGWPSRYEAKHWPVDRAEPEEWTLSAAGLSTELPSGSVALCAHHVDASFGPVSVESA